MKQPIQKYLKAGFQSGLSLVELMISITIGLFILASLSGMFVNQSKARAELDKSNRMIDNGRYALELLSSNLRMAGFYDDYIPVNAIVNNMYGPCDTASLIDPTKTLEILHQPVQGYNAAVSGTTSQQQVASPPCSLTYTGSNPTLRNGSDILVVRRASTASVAASSAITGTIYMQVLECDKDPAAVPPFNPYQILTAPNAASFATMHKKDCVSTADLRPFIVTTYFVSPNNKVTSGVGDGIPTLKQIDQYGNITPLVEGIEYLQVDYGIDSDSDGAPDSYAPTCATAACWSSVVAVRISLLARNTEKTVGWSENKTYSLGLTGSAPPYTTQTVTPAAGDQFKRHVFTQLVRLVNPAGRREVP